MKLHHPAGQTSARAVPGADAIDIVSWMEAVRAQRAAAQGVARLIADTLRVQFPQAAYLVLWIDHERDTATDLFPDSIRDAGGRILTDFTEADPLPPLPGAHPLRALWGSHEPADVFQVRHLLRTLRLGGGDFDNFPEDLRNDQDDEGDIPCLLLSGEARPERWEAEDEDHSERLLRPYTAPRPFAGVVQPGA
ncbi:hypothetical protein ACWC0C_19880 [Streptomyces sp. NPDC001709]